MKHIRNFWAGGREKLAVDTELTGTTKAIQSPQDLRSKLASLPNFRLVLDLDEDLPLDAPKFRAHAPQDIPALATGSQGSTVIHDGIDTAKSLTPNQIANQIIALAPYGDTDTVQSLQGQLDPYSEAYRRSRPYVAGMLASQYVHRLASLDLSDDSGPQGLLPVPADRDNYPVWYGHFNGVLSEIVTTAGDADTYTSAAITAALGPDKYIPDPMHTFSKEDNYMPFSRSVTAAAIISQIPWHPRFTDAKNADFGKGIDY